MALKLVFAGYAFVLLTDCQKRSFSISSPIRLLHSAFPFTLLAIQTQARRRELPLLFPRHMAIYPPLDTPHIWSLPPCCSGVRSLDAAWERQESMAVRLGDTVDVCSGCWSRGSTCRQHCRVDVSLFTIIRLGSPLHLIPSFRT